jgi:hypothetical protein
VIASRQAVFAEEERMTVAATTPDTRIQGGWPAGPVADPHSSLRAGHAPVLERAAGWPSEQAAPILLSGIGTRAAASATPDDARAHALLAEDVYNDQARPPAGYRVAGADDLAALNLRPEMLVSGEFRGRVYATEENGETHYIIAFRGSQSAQDWVTNARQGVGLDSVHYTQALEIAEAVGTSEAAGRVSFAGHSLGGGLASAAAIAAGVPAHTFNAAGLHDATISHAEAMRDAAGIHSRDSVNAWYVRGEILSVIQDGGDRIIGTIIGGPIIGFFTDAPAAYGERHRLDAVVPEGKSEGWFPNRVDRHGMDWVLSSLPK